MCFQLQTPLRSKEGQASKEFETEFASFALNTEHRRKVTHKIKPTMLQARILFSPQDALVCRGWIVRFKKG